MSTLRFALILILLAPAATAETVTYSYTGVVDESTGESTGIFAFAFDGTVVTGTISFDDRLFDRVGGGGGDEFANFTPVQNQAHSESFKATMTIGALTLTQIATEPTLPHASLTLTDADPGFVDSVAFVMVGTGPTVPGNDFFALRFIDPTGIALGAGGGDLTSSIGGAISILDNLDVSLFNPSALPRSVWLARDEFDQEIGLVVFNANSLARVTAVPSSPSMPLLLSGVLVLIGLGSLLSAEANRKAKSRAVEGPGGDGGSRPEIRWERERLRAS